MKASLFFIPLLLALVRCNCPDGYSQMPDDGDCYESHTFYDYFNSRWMPQDYNSAERGCSSGAGLLAAIHNQEENDFIHQLPCEERCDWMNIGLKCIGKACKWDDGSQMTFTNFVGEGPKDDGAKRCFSMDHSSGYWSERDCGSHQSDCWICQVKTRKIECVDGETAFHAGCVSVHTTPLTHQEADESCPDGGHLVSIHCYGNDQTENGFYKNLALKAGINETFYIGGYFSESVFRWTDGTYPSAAVWANWFPNTVFGNCVQMLLDSELGDQGYWTNIDCNVELPYICFRDGTVYNTTEPTQNISKTNGKCPPLQYFTGHGKIYSPNYPVSIPNHQTCEYIIGTDDGTIATIKFSPFDCQSGTSLALYDGLNSNQPFITFTSNIPSNESYYATSNVLKVVFTTNGDSDPVGTGWEIAFTGATATCQPTATATSTTIETTTASITIGSSTAASIVTSHPTTTSQTTTEQEVTKEETVGTQGDDTSTTTNPVVTSPTTPTTTSSSSRHPIIIAFILSCLSLI